MDTTDNSKDIVMNNQSRLHRAGSWFQCAVSYQDDEDVAFITLWVAFNACYGDENNHGELSEHESFKRFIGKLVYHDDANMIYDCLWRNFPDFVAALIDSPYVFAPFWKVQRDGKGYWQDEFERSKITALKALSESRVDKLLIIVLDRLYVLRNQLMHGGASYKGHLNRQQVKNGQRFMMTLMPIIIEIMTGAINSDWGKVYYPAVEA